MAEPQLQKDKEEIEKKAVVLNLVVPEKLKPKFRKAYGKIYTSFDKMKISGLLITVGDVASSEAIKAGLEPDVIVYDGKEMREPVNEEVLSLLESYDAERVEVKNPPSYITEELWKAVRSCMPTNKRIKIFVEGEEDLAVLPFILESSIGTNIIYSLAGKGIVLVKVNENIKRVCKKLLEQMKKVK